MIDVSIIIVNYNTCELTKQCIDSIFDKTKEVSFEVIVVDNDSKDNSVEMLSADARIVFIESGVNIGFGRANNLGLEKAKGKYVFFLNSDTLLLNNAVKYFFDFAENNLSLSIGGLGCQLVNGDYEHVHSSSKFPKMFETFKYEIKDHIAAVLNAQKANRNSCMYKDSPFGYYEVDYVTGADLFVSRAVLNLYGKFDPDFFMYYEETEMQFRWRKSGLKQFVIDGPRIVHLEQKSTVRSNNFARELRDTKSRILYFKKTEHSFNYYMFRFLLLIFRIHYLVKPSLSFRQKQDFFNLILR